LVKDSGQTIKFLLPPATSRKHGNEKGTGKKRKKGREGVLKKKSNPKSLFTPSF
jgi:hypothetical protein